MYIDIWCITSKKQFDDMQQKAFECLRRLVVGESAFSVAFLDFEVTLRNP